MTDKTISPLRQRMIDDMTVRNFGEKTQQRLHPGGQDLDGVPGPIAGHGHGGGSCGGFSCT